MSPSPDAISYEPLMDLPDRDLTLIEGLPGHGMVAALAAHQVVHDLDLDHYGNFVSDEFPAEAVFEDGRVVEPVRVHGDAEVGILVLESKVAIPDDLHREFGRAVLNAFADRIDRAVFLAAAPSVPALSPDAVGAVATDDDVETALLEAGIELSPGPGHLGGVTGALVQACFREGVPAAAFLVAADPYVPDLGAAETLVVDAIEPFVGVHVDTDRLHEKAEEIERQRARLFESPDRGEGAPEKSGAASMFQ